jgi:hypothetical protein
MIPPPPVLKRGPGDPDSLFASTTCAALAATVTLPPAPTARISPQTGRIWLLIPGARAASFSPAAPAFPAFQHP